jgi:hypothetical protein
MTNGDPRPPEWFYRTENADRALPELAKLHHAGCVTPALIRELLPWLWRNKPDRVHLETTEILDLFRSTGLSSSGPRLGRRPLVLYRGATEANRSGPSWTANPAIARYFAEFRQADGAVGEVWTAPMPPNRIVAFLADEDEFIVDLDGIEHRITPAKSTVLRGLRTRWRARQLRLHWDALRP